ncbi:HNH endonuclease [Vibrio atlanticus]|nr:HNH endonuclease [Vibrio atlanticus]
MKLSNDPLCEMCSKYGRFNTGVIIDHIKEINHGGAIWEYDNLMTLCISCHNTKTAKARKNNNNDISS